MIYELRSFVNGPFDKERPFQNACMKKLKMIYPADTFVSIETEETEPGMPDSMRLSSVRPSLLIEYKVSNTEGVIKFQKSQPMWYKRHSDLQIIIIAWDKRQQKCILLTAAEVYHNASLTFPLPLYPVQLPFESFNRSMIQ